MKTGRLEAFSDGVLAIAITIMVLEMKAPHDTSFKALLETTPVFTSYVLSFVYIGVYWNNHHHLMQASQKVNGKILWANLHLLFWLSLIPFTTSWMGENDHYTQTVPVVTYGFVLLMCACAYFLLERALIQLHEENSKLHKISKRRLKDYASFFIYLIALPLAYLNTWLSIGCYIIVAIIWLIPDRELEKIIQSSE